MIGERVIITVENGPKGMMGEIVKIDHQLGLYGIREDMRGNTASLWWFNREDFEVLEDEA